MDYLLILILLFPIVAVAMSLRTVVKRLRRYCLQSVKLPLRIREAEGNSGGTLPPIQTVHVIENVHECEEHVSKLIKTRTKVVGMFVRMFVCYMTYLNMGV